MDSQEQSNEDWIRNIGKNPVKAHQAMHQEINRNIGHQNSSSRLLILQKPNQIISDKSTNHITHHFIQNLDKKKSAESKQILRKLQVFNQRIGTTEKQKQKMYRKKYYGKVRFNAVFFITRETYKDQMMIDEDLVQIPRYIKNDQVQLQCKNYIQFLIKPYLSHQTTAENFYMRSYYGVDFYLNDKSIKQTQMNSKIALNNLLRYIKFDSKQEQKQLKYIRDQMQKRTKKPRQQNQDVNQQVMQEEM